MTTLLSAEDLKAIRKRFWRNVAFVVIAAIIIAGLVVIVWPRAQRPNSRTGAPLTSHVTVLSDSGIVLPNRLAVLFVSGLEVGRTDADGQVHGYLPTTVRAIPDSLRLREGQIQRVSFPPDAQAIAYAFPGDAGSLKPDIVTCPQLTLGKSGQIGCNDGSGVPIPNYGIWLMEALFAVIFFPLFALAGEQVIPPPRDWPRFGKSLRANLIGLLLTGIGIVMLSTTDAFQKAMYKLANTFEYATAMVVSAICFVLGAAAVIIWLRTHFQVPRTR